MRMREQDLGLHGAVVTLGELEPQCADARTGVEDHELTPGALHGYARRVAAIARGVGPRGGDRAARSPKRHPVGHRSRHAAPRAKLWKIQHVEQAAGSRGPRDPTHPRVAASGPPGPNLQRSALADHNLAAAALDVALLAQRAHGATHRLPRAPASPCDAVV